MRQASLIFLAFALLAGGCSTMQPTQFAQERPLLDPVKYFTGATNSSGVMETRGGDPMRRVTTQTDGKWDGSVLLLEQELAFSDGTKQHRSWRIRRLDAHHFEATANDMVGTARGEAYGNCFHWSFTLALSPGNPLGNVRMTQWMYLQPDGRTLLNHSTIRKFGLVVAQVTEQFRRENAR
ncbi:MAG: DUF3833 family protein [Chthoniobacterales bacterium]